MRKKGLFCMFLFLLCTVCPVCTACRLGAPDDGQNGTQEQETMATSQAETVQEPTTEEQTPDSDNRTVTETAAQNPDMPEAFWGICEDVLFGDEAKRWSEQARGLVEASPNAYEGFEICSIYRDGKWDKALYNEERGIVVCDMLDNLGRRSYVVYKDGQSLTLPAEHGRGFGIEAVIINFRDVEQDGEEELFIYDGAYFNGIWYLYVIRTDGLRALDMDFGIEEFLEQFHLDYRVEDYGNNGAKILTFSFEDGEGNIMEGYIDPDKKGLIRFADFGDYKRSDLEVLFSFGIGEEAERRYGHLEAPIIYDAALERYILGGNAQISWGSQESVDLEAAFED